MADHKDLTLTPKMYVDENPVIQTEYRHVTKNSNSILDVSYNQGYKKASGNKSDSSRAHLFAKTNIYHSLEIGPGTGMFSKEFRQWRLNYFLDVLPEIENPVRRRFKPPHQKYLKFYITRHTECSNIPQGSCNFVSSWDTFVFFTQTHIQQYLHDIKRILIPGGYCFIHYADCHFDFDLREAKRGYWNYNTKTAMEKMIKDEGYEIIEMAQFKPGANYAIFKNPGNQNPAVYKISEITID